MSGVRKTAGMKTIRLPAAGRGGGEETMLTGVNGGNTAFVAWAAGPDEEETSLSAVDIGRLGFGSVKLIKTNLVHGYVAG